MFKINKGVRKRLVEHFCASSNNDISERWMPIFRSYQNINSNFYTNFEWKHPILFNLDVSYWFTVYKFHENKKRNKYATHNCNIRRTIFNGIGKHDYARQREHKRQNNGRGQGLLDALQPSTVSWIDYHRFVPIEQSMHGNWKGALARHSAPAAHARDWGRAPTPPPPPLNLG